ncbi:MAG: GNAT family N-acetyltransferase [Ornithinimicrobium sp.]|uniref:GNAT family N-acetyltransferase n=1 Tax=Ornithinimicrobium sp. TaxID=1977084 RepID=UPI0026DF1D97|nr:GNAT family N-acetyltransferase [Ornithinimicrobium sp.]MDO5738515.1 GNAT family N-acetyltransferase [Ornithinimicrobium sp.]
MDLDLHGHPSIYRSAPLSADDVPAWADLVNHLAVVDGTEEFQRVDDLRAEFERTGFDPLRDSLAVWDDEAMVAFGVFSVPPTTDNDGNGRGYLQGGVRESHRGRGLGSALLETLLPHAADLVRERHAEVTASYLRASGGLSGSSAQGLLSDHGFRVVRYYNELTRPLNGTVEVDTIEGVQLVSPGAEHAEATRLAHNDAFRDHWGSGPQSAATWHEHWTGTSRRGEVSTVALTTEGTVLAYVLCSEWVDRELYVDILGTVRTARGRGVAQAALLRTITEAARSGSYDVIALGVDSSSQTGATRLYERVGFTHKLATTSMQRDLPLTSS